MISNHENFARSALRNAMPIESRETVDVTSGMVNWVVVESYPLIKRNLR